ncbi:MAG: hypothetical protein ACK5JD_06150 [Mangrovibacterium sp.]
MNRLKLMLLGIPFFLLITLAANPVFAEEQLQQDIERCRERTNAAWTFASDAVHELQFIDGASSYEELRNYCFNALTVLDSLDIALRQAEYAVTDATYELKEKENEQSYTLMLNVKNELKQASQFQGASKQQLQAILDESNITAINQKLFDTADNLNNCARHIKSAQAGLKILRKTLPKNN